MKIRKLLVLALVINIFCVGLGAYAASYTVKSNGVFRYDGNGNGAYTDSEDVYIDSSDLVNINSHVSTLKTGLEGYVSQLQAVESGIERLSNDIASVNNNLGGLRFYEDDNGKKYVVGADLEPKEIGGGGGKIYILGVGRSFNISGIVGATNVGKYTNGNFIAVPSSGVSLVVDATYTLSDKKPSAVTNVSSGTVAYDASTGTVTVSGFSASATICKYANGSGAMDSRYADLPVTVYFVDCDEILSTW